LIYAEIELINGDDLAFVIRHILGEEEIRRMRVTALVDIGSYMLCINENIQEQLHLPFLKKRKGQMADGSIKEYEVVGPVELKFKNWKTVINAMILTGNNEVLFGSIPMEDMDVLIPPLRQELIVNPEYPYFAQMKLK